ncbi:MULTISPECIES: alpha/beta fold hydrolase [unclassified Rathayibacter]|uniref:alpha/beta hydrolase family protein n=1 Tax=unclassified Rathayibacter TaxID=2609250 RepID=UPI00188AE92F|nr:MULTISPECIES: alpha/beta fold hydrolase [unclassified Rathayibacter]MBF4463108.1 alpha/beta fold hydrolase [Rathayibacter sp. VKM Ac-2879]MBF4504655.1 alpha/beta fold hydrolase [Rathayibacter sp. VKM Ac-2878]
MPLASPSLPSTEDTTVIKHVVPISDGTQITLTVVPPTGPDTGRHLYVLPAMGIRSSYYRALSHRLAARGFTVVLTDLRGEGEATPLASRQTTHGYVEIVERDIPESLAHLRTVLGAQQIWLLGHSLGGQLGLIADSRTRSTGAPGFEGVVLVGSGSSWHRAQNGWRAPRNRIVPELFVLVSRLVGHFPGDRLGFAHRQSTRLMIDCARQSRTGRFAAPGAAEDYDASLASLERRVLVFDIDGDRLTSRRAVDHLCAAIPRARITRRDHPIVGRPLRDPHVAWVRQSPQLPDEIADWILEQG